MDRILFLDTETGGLDEFKHSLLRWCGKMPKHQRTYSQTY